ncbi:MAG: hypothetical protein EPO21_09265 [Chloroflexota bacterium]|nr:MAG: hypothetical protein EPO21_09265 [Chloroflexota bacterium]
MKNTRTLWAALVALVVALSSIVTSFAQPPAGNLVSAELTRGHWYFTDQDSISNTSIQYDDWVFADIYKWTDGGAPVVNPTIQISTKLGLTGFNPTSAPAVTFVADKDAGVYSWSLAGNVNEDTHMSVSAVAGTTTARPKFSASRSVQPEILADPTSQQTVTLNFKLEEALPLEANLSVVIGLPNFAYKTFQLVDTHFVSQIDVDGWESRPGSTSASWSINPSNIQIGETYTFQATLESVKSPLLLGAPLYKPMVAVFYSDHQGFGIVNGTSAAVSDPAEIVSAVFSADNVVNWMPFFRSFRWDVGFNPVVSQITGSQPPFHVLIPADVRIEPETVNLGSKGVVTAFVQLPKPYRVQDVDISSVTLQGAPATGRVVDGDTLLLKFNRDQLQNLSPGQQVELVIKGQLKDGSIFTGKDAVRIIP